MFTSTCIALQRARLAPMADDWERLVEQHLHLVHAIAARQQRRLGKTMERGDLVGYGTQGLIEAAQKYDPKVGSTFATFAYYRIRGAIYDGMRMMAWYSRSEYARYRAEEREDAYLAAAAEQEDAVRAANPDVASGKPARGKEELLGDIARLLGGLAAVRIVSLEAAREVPDQRSRPADEQIATEEANQLVREALAGLPEKERRLIDLYYYGDMNLQEAGAQLGLSKSWACRLHNRAADRLRALLAELQERRRRP